MTVELIVKPGKDAAPEEREALQKSVSKAPKNL